MWFKSENNDEYDEYFLAKRSQNLRCGHCAGPVQSAGKYCPNCGHVRVEGARGFASLSSWFVAGERSPQRLNVRIKTE